MLSDVKIRNAKSNATRLELSDGNELVLRVSPDGKLNRALVVALEGDVGTHNADRVLRVPGTIICQMPKNGPEVEYLSGLIWLPN
jgi:hypothetical protein